MSDRLIFTFLGLEGALAAAAYLRYDSKAELFVSSAAIFPDRLSEFSDTRGSDFVILGLGYRDRTTEMAEAIKSLLDAGNSITWLMTAVNLSHFAEQFSTFKRFTVLNDTGTDILSLTLKHLSVDHRDLRRIRSDGAAKDNWELIIHDALFRASNYRDYKAYPDIIRRLAAGESITDSEKSRLKSTCRHECYLIGSSRPMKELKDTIRLIGRDSLSNILICGETGTGKETVAVALHRAGARDGHPFVTTSCANFSENLLESELFGFEKGAFTGADHSSRGLFEEADSGTLFLDEIGEMSLRLQAKLLRVLQEKRFRRIGGRQDIAVNTRVIAATNRDLLQMIHQGQFREDLFHRLAQLVVRTVPLRAHPEDIPRIAGHIMRRLAQERGIAPRDFTPQEIAGMK
ncbi:MAG: sigma 54-interacting transcriptional regulator, partial [Candidatus Wallbacteria bacterium]|nr:sigma 54-interacting transcriptional regulator [Candidatus Wallbacteria bacterium]